MKLCKDCVHCHFKNPNIRDRFFYCTEDQEKINIDLVTGEVITEGLTNCYTMRNMETACGKEGKLYVAKGALV